MDASYWLVSPRLSACASASRSLNISSCIKLRRQLFEHTSPPPSSTPTVHILRHLLCASPSPKPTGLHDTPPLASPKSASPQATFFTMSLNIVPPKSLPTATSSASSAPSAPGLHDNLRDRLSLNPSSSSTKSSSFNSSSTQAGTATAQARPLDSTHPLESRLTNWRATQDALKMDLLRRNYGIAEPVRRGMEHRIVGAGEWRPAALGGTAGVHADVLSGRDTEIGWEDVFGGGEELRNQPDFHAEMEARFKMDW